MSSSVAVDAFRADEWEREAARKADETTEASHPALPEATTRCASAGLERTPPWPQRRLNEALAELGPARPESSGSVTAWSRADQEMPKGTGRVSSAASRVDIASSNDSAEPETVVPTRENLPPPPRPYFQPFAQPFDTAIADQGVLPWDDAALADVDPAGADIIRALASADLQPGDAALRPPFVVSHVHDHDGEQERPPMIIERALAEQGLGMMSIVPAARRVSPLPALAVGFLLSLLAGAALYLVMTAG